MAQQMHILAFRSIGEITPRRAVSSAHIKKAPREEDYIPRPRNTETYQGQSQRRGISESDLLGAAG